MPILKERESMTFRMARAACCGSGERNTQHSHQQRVWGLVLLWTLGVLCVLGPAGAVPVDGRKAVHTFYYLWYGSPETDGHYIHWDHEVLAHWDSKKREEYPYGMRFSPPDTVHSPFYPSPGPYSSRSRETIRRHLQELHDAGVGVIVVSWWGPEWRGVCHDTQGVVTDRVLPVLLEEVEASSTGIQVAFHLEPYAKRTASSVKQDLEYLMHKYGESSAILRLQGKPVYYVYDSYHTPAAEWATILHPSAPNTLRNTHVDGVFLGLWLNQDDGQQQILPGHFDGFYTYFGCEATSWAANPAAWDQLAGWAAKHGKLFVPSVAPGYNDSLIRPWNAATARSREGGSRYDRYWAAALASDADIVSITSFNEWGEGTQIEPAIPMCSNATHITYEGYTPHAPDYYLRITEQWSTHFQQVLNRRCANPEGNKVVCAMLSEFGAAGEDEEDEYV